MSLLTERYPGVRCITSSLSANAAPDEDDSLLAPFLSWTLVEIDTSSIDIMLMSATHQELVILIGRLAQRWLALVQQTSTW